ncbi:glycine-rich domain-containing protein, partial [Mesohalobacter salilacus]|uniref:glycine-rich domain-containing protein n=1 Tax=Mesohalobacter salilacus TaxID=2491711 RepID=UPI000FA863A4
MKKLFTLILLIFISNLSFAQNGDEIFVQNISGTDYVIHKFTTTGTSSFTPPSGITEVDVLVVGGGGAGIENLSFSGAGGSGGGAGGYVFKTNFNITSFPSPINVVVGAGGLKRANPNGTGVSNSGEDSNFGTITALGGGGASMNGQNGNIQALDGGSGGGSRDVGNAGSGLQPSQPAPSDGLGNDGGNTPSASLGTGAGGGGGAGSAGADGGGPSNGFGGNGGAGVQNNIDGTNNFYAGGGGGGGSQSSAIGLGGSGVGGNGANDSTPATDGQPNTGGGGGGGNNSQVAGNGGSGVVIVRYRLSDVTDFVFTSDGDWNVNTNWANNTLPTLGADVIIAANPQVTTDETVGNIEVFTGVSVDINNGVNLNVEGDISHLGEFTGDGEVVINGTSAQAISGSGSFENLRLDNPTALDINDQTDLFGILYVDRGTLNTNNNLTLKCSFPVTQFAQFGTVSGMVSGNVTVEQCFPARRAFRLVSSSVTTSTNINANWQEGATGYLNNPNPGFGTHITGVEPGSANATIAQDGNNGFDYSPSGNASLFTFSNDNTQQWNAVSNTATNTLTAGDAYRLMIRGDRSIDVTNNGTTPTNTILRSTGSIEQGPVSLNFSINAGQFAMVGNPYHSIVDMNAVLTGSGFTGFFTVWNPTLGGAPNVGQPGGRGAFVTVNASNGNATIQGGASGTNEMVQFLQPYQAFFVEAAVNNPSLAFQETDKDVLQNQVAVFSTTPSSYISMSMFDQLSYNDNNTADDGLVIYFSQNTSNAVDANDAPKFFNIDENLARTENNSLLSYENRALPQSDEVLGLYTSQYRTTDYVFQIEVGDFPNNPVYLFDHYTDTEVVLNENAINTYTFSVDQSIAESVATDRFDIRF